MKTKLWYIQMDLKTLMWKYGKNCTFAELKEMGVL